MKLPLPLNIKKQLVMDWEVGLMVTAMRSDILHISSRFDGYGDEIRHIAYQQVVNLVNQICALHIAAVGHPDATARPYSPQTKRVRNPPGAAQLDMFA